MVISTFGLINRGKGLEYAIEAMREIVKRHPEALYLILGETHPVIRRNEGETYRESLQASITEYGLQGNVRLVDHYLEFDELVNYLQATDVYLTPYLNPVQIVSGTLAYAVGCGKAVVSTPYLYAEELLAHGRGFLVDFRSAASIAATITALLDDPDLRHATERRAYRFGRQMTWPHVADAFSPRPSRCPRKAMNVTSYPMLDHLVAMTDDTGMIQHATHDIPNRATGYCTDDIARALIVAVTASRKSATESIGKRLVSTYLSYLHDSQMPDSWFHNFMGYDRTWQDHRGTADSFGRAMWGLGYCMRFAPRDSWRSLAGRLFSAALPRVSELEHLRPRAYCALGIVHALEAPESDRLVLCALLADAVRPIAAAFA